MYYNYRLYLSGEVPSLDSEQIEQIFNESKELNIVRIAISMTNKSISLLSHSPIEMDKMKQLLLIKKITLCDIQEEKILDEEETVHEHNHTHGHNHAHEHNHAHGHNHGHGHENHWLKFILGLIWGIGLVALSIVSFNIPVVAYYVITGLTTLMTLYLGHSVYQTAWNTLRKKKWDSTLLYSISTLTIVIVSIASLFIPGLPMMFEAAPLVLSFWHLGEGVEHKLIERINNKTDVRDCLSPLATLKGKPDKEISINTIIPNDILMIKSGQTIPVDGVLIKETLLYTTRINGSPELKLFHPGDAVKAGMCLPDNSPPLEMCAQKTYQNSYLSVIAKKIDNASNEKAPVEIFANKVLRYFIPALLGIALISGVLIGVVFTPILAIQCVIAVLVSACPCALSLITPMAVKIGMQKTSENGIHFKSGKALQAASDIDTIVFDLNGTLTQGELKVKKMRIDKDAKKLLPHIALLESQSPHPAAKIITSYIKNENITSKEDLEVTDVNHDHSGIKGKINNEVFIVGNRKMLSNNGIKLIKPYDDSEKGSVYIVRGTKVIGQIDLTDPLRNDAKETVNQLKRLGKTVHICTGADQATAEKYAASLGISKNNICANAVGVEIQSNEISKEKYIRNLQKKGCKVAMIGDAANDAVAIASSNLGVAIKSSIGDEITQQKAHIVVYKGLLSPLVTAFDVAKKTKRNIIQNLFISLTYNSVITLVAAGLFVALGFTLNPAIGVALVVLESALVLANLYHFKQQKISSTTSTIKKTPLNEPLSESSFVHILNGLDHQTKPEANRTSITLPKSTAQNSSLFMSRKNHSSLIYQTTLSKAIHPMH